jgi:hypothetical protein
MDSVTGLPAAQVTTATAGTSNASLPEPWILPVQLVCVGDETLQLPAKVLRKVPVLVDVVNRTDRVLPVKVPTILVLIPSDGNDPEYLLGMSPAASATAESRIAPTLKTIDLRIDTSPIQSDLSFNYCEWSRRPRPICARPRARN